MAEPTKEQLTREALQKTLEWAETAEGFVAEQAPAVAQEMVAWGYASHWMGLAFSLVILAVTTPTIVVCARKISREFPEDPFWPNALGVISGLAWALALVGVFVDTYNLVYITVAPRLYVLEQTTKMLGM